MEYDNATTMHIDSGLTYKKVDDWLGQQSRDVPTAWHRLKWAWVYLGDAWVEIFNQYQMKYLKRRSQIVSRLIAASAVLLPLIAIALYCPVHG